MSDALSLAMSAAPITVIQPSGASLTPAQTPTPPAPDHININAPFYISPAISFDPVADIVIYTYRNSETGKVTRQVPPEAVLSRYQAVDETGVPAPAPHVRTSPATPAGTDQQASSGTLPSPTPPQPAPPQPAPTGTGSQSTATVPPSPATIIA
jgi:hypothetical protein